MKTPETEKLCQIECDEWHVVAIWKCLRTVIKKKATSGPADDALIMETMSDLAPFQHTGVVILPFNKMRLCWLAVKVCLDDGFIPEGEESIKPSEALWKMAQALDFTREKTMEKDPNEILNGPAAQTTQLQLV